ncbi:MAG: hypothetical protein JO325_23965 [Solirubrobacterales bacterium]|nr:hypothetical protein [Solirubrobacterales bacterium]
MEGLLDELLGYYIDWHYDAAAVRTAYSWWSAATGPDEAPRFSAYMAALDQEQASALRYALVLREVERGLEFEASVPGSLSDVPRTR